MAPVIRTAAASVRIIFITGTDTGVGKTILTGLLLAHLRQRGRSALALKPFCSGARGDVRLIQALQDGELPVDELNPFYFPEPVAPAAAARRHRGGVQLKEALKHIRHIAARLGQQAKRNRGECVLLIEGVGGLLVPLGRDFTVRDLIQSLDCEVIVVARNRLGTLNHTLLTFEALCGRPRTGAPVKALPRLVLMGSSRPDASARSNARMLSKWLAPVPVFQLPFLGARCRSAEALQAHARRLKPQLERVLNDSRGARVGYGMFMQNVSRSGLKLS